MEKDKQLLSSSEPCTDYYNLPGYFTGWYISIGRENERLNIKNQKIAVSRDFILDRSHNKK